MGEPMGAQFVGMDEGVAIGVVVNRVAVGGVDARFEAPASR